MVLHAMLVSIQAAIDIANHLIAERGLSKPSTYREGFEILGQAGLIPEELAGELSDLAGFRNVLVHVYWGLNSGEVHEILQNDLWILRSFRGEVLECCASSSEVRCLSQDRSSFGLCAAL